jgi:A-kinase anchor protein 10
VNIYVDDDQLLSPDCFRPAVECVQDILTRVHFPEFLQSVYYCKYQLELLACPQLTDILYNHSALMSFTEVRPRVCLWFGTHNSILQFMDVNHRRNWVEFWLAVETYRRRRDDDDDPTTSSTHVQQDAIVLYEKYVCKLDFTQI